ncbi:poly (ADP-ribose) polymerase family protein (macronuclear) [Tetrahymena thermophila SB210]|uniref:Poly [ADP-ribose] polymerase n=1 Tax=Tetrahymena thermophila (strain SB210) TaxID=312017 RepID=Q22SC9_TETTS|nr:poly (ADP-ribose) polymerase family protein [Tetrahymena thermophila SB210]EAR87843.2 poly (ADP-ribose) polymerase family protein [Tetrahymena thermophila SB210]|eukprot:XP_001008088.2 poly (ADP-ribose) polymerase family protein [Tetrahymena thermophila SB210]
MDSSPLNIQRVSQQMFEIDDPFILMMIQKDNQKEIQNLEQKYQIKIQINQGYGQVHILQQEDSIEEHLDQSIVDSIEKHFNNFEKVQKKKVTEQYVECNRDFYLKLNKVLQKYHTKLQQYHLDFIGNESQQDYDQNKIYQPLVVKSIQIQDKFLIQTCKIEQPEYLNFEEIDVLVLNMTQQGLFVDDFGYQLVNSNPGLKQLIKQLKQQIKTSNFIDEHVFYQGKKAISLLIQLQEDEKVCIDNLQVILNKLKEQKYKQKGHLRISVAIRECCGKKYVEAFGSYIKQAIKQKSYLNFPSEINFIVNERNENLISQQLDNLKKIELNEKEKLGLLSLFTSKSKKSQKEDKMWVEESIQSSLLRIQGKGTEVEEIVKIFKKLQQDCFIRFELPLNNGSLTEELVKYLQEIAIKQTMSIEISEKSVSIYAYKKTINKFLPIIANQIRGSQTMLRIQCQVPPNWSNQRENLLLVNLDLSSPEAMDCITAMKKTLPNSKVSRIQRVQNIKLWRNYMYEKQKLVQKGNAKELLLFHGTRNNKPEMIYNGTEEGFDFRLSAHGMYGRGTYFHEMASYSDGYAYHDGSKKVFFLAQVLVGNYYVGGSSGYVSPPIIPGTNGLRYDSIRSNYNEGQNMFIIYHNSKAYPTYLIDYN